MKLPSLSLIASQIFLGYILYSIYSLSQLFVPPPCEKGEPCLTSYLRSNPQLGLRIFSSTTKHPFDREVSIIHKIDNFDYTQSHNMHLTLDIPRKTQQNGTLFMHFVVSASNTDGKSYNQLLKDPRVAHTTVKITRYAIPDAEVFNLLGDKHSSKEGKKKDLRPVSHLKSKVAFTMMTDDIELPTQSLPLELFNHIKVMHNMFLPIVTYDFLQTRHRDLLRITPHNSTANITVSYMPISIGKLRLMLHVEVSMQSLKRLGFSDKDVDEVKGIYADTNIYLLGGTFFIAAIHLLFDFLAFKNDVSFWRRKNNLAGLSIWTVAWRAFSQSIIFLYLLDEGSSLLVLIPAGIGTMIEIWKLKKILRVDFVNDGGFIPKIRINKNVNDVIEKKTREFDAESMRYLSYLLYPLVIVGAIYSLLYQPHKSWYSWSIHSLANGVYAFGFLFMLPQLFVNYKLKSVAHLPWRAFMYKAFNTFIDDVFAFIITMPTAHRIACFRDDAVFLVYLYQRWLYPVDKSRIDTGSMSEDPIEFNTIDKKTN